MVSFYKNVKTG